MGLDSEPDDALIAAAEAAASWAHARRAKWTNAPLPVPEPGSGFEDIEFEFEPQPAPVATPPKAPPPPVASPPAPVAAAPPLAPPPVAQAPPVVVLPPAVPPRRIASEDFVLPEHVVPASPPPVPPPAAPAQAPAPPASARIAEKVRGLGEPLRQWLPRIAAVAALGAIVFAGVRYLPGVLASFTARKAAVEAPAQKPSGPPPAARKTTGALSVKSTPGGAQVLVDGKPRGVTPLALNDISPGRHDVVLRSAEGTVRRSVTVTANNTATIEEAIFSGWVSVLSPIEVEIVENGRVLRPDDRSQIMLPPGVHDLRFSNKTLGYDATRQIEVKPGEATTIRVTPEPCLVTVTTNEPAEVLIDGKRIGDAPLLGVGVPLGTHELVVHRLAGGERRYTVTLGTAPYTLHVDF